MLGVSFTGPSDEIESVALALLGMGIFEPMPLEVMMEGRPLNSRFQTFRGNSYDVLLESLNKLLRGGGLPIPDRSFADRLPPLSLTELEERIAALERTVDAWGRELAELREEREKWRAMLAFGDAVREAGRSLSDFSRASYGCVAIGTLSIENWRRLQETGLAAPILVMPLIAGAEKTTAIVFYDREYREDMDRIFSSVHMHLIPVRPENYDRYENADAVRYQLEAAEAEIDRCQAMPWRYLSDNRAEVEKLYAAVYAKQRVYALCRFRGELDGMTALAGWIPRDSYDAVRVMAARKAPHALLTAESDDAIEKAGYELPTLLRNLPLVRRFQEIVRLYSLPSYSELDPTFVVALSFCFFFGFMFGDVGHGFALILGTWFLERKKVMGHAIASVMRIAGAFAILFGFLYGSVFGDESLLHPLWLSPMRDVNTILPVSIGVGIVFLTIGIVFKVQNAARKREWGEVLFSPEGLSGLLFYWLAVAQAVAVTGAVPGLALEGAALPTKVFAVIMGILFLLMIFGNGIAGFFFHGETVDEGGVVHVFSVFHAMLNFISNTASFVRLAAFALNHAGLCGAVLMLGNMVEKAPGGRLYHAFIMVIGHIVIVGLEGMIVFIQTLRLEYYEFFGKFYRGGGREFAPVLWKK
jgi:V/A-type H+-transporting ATPase subunit I